MARLISFGLVGASAALLQLFLLVLLVEFGSLEPVIASAAAYSLSAVYNYALNRRLTFRSDRPHRRAAPRFIAMVLIGLGLNAAFGWAWADPLVALVVAGFAAYAGIDSWRESSESVSTR